MKRFCVFSWNMLRWSPSVFKHALFSVRLQATNLSPPRSRTSRVCLPSPNRAPRDPRPPLLPLPSRERCSRLNPNPDTKWLRAPTETWRFTIPQSAIIASLNWSLRMALIFTSRIRWCSSHGFMSEFNCPRFLKISWGKIYCAPPPK